MHESLRLTDDTPCGTRGVVAASVISEEDLLERPLVLVPKTLHLDNTVAAAAIKARMSDHPHRQGEVDALEQVQVWMRCSKFRLGGGLAMTGRTVR